MRIVPVSNKALEPADTDGFALDAADALALALGFLGAYTAADCGESGGLADDLICAFKIAFLDLGDEFGDMDIYGAAAYAGHILAVEAAECFVKCHFLGIADGDFVEIMGPDLRILAGHGVLFKTHVRHITLPPS